MGVHILEMGEIEDYLPAGKRKLDEVIKLVQDSSLKEWLSSTWATPTTQEIVRVALAAIGEEAKEIAQLPALLGIE